MGNDATRYGHADDGDPIVNIPKTRMTYCKGKDCKKHTQHKVTQYKAGKVRSRQQPRPQIREAKCDQTWTGGILR